MSYNIKVLLAAFTLILLFPAFAICGENVDRNVKSNNQNLSKPNLLPEEVAVHISTCPISTLDQILLPFLNTFNRNEEDGHEHGHNHSDGVNRLATYFSILFRFPVNKIDYYVDSSRGVDYLIMVKGDGETTRTQGALLPMKNFGELEQEWRNTNAKQEGFDFIRIKDEKMDNNGELLYRMNYPNEKTVFCLSLKQGGAIVAGSETDCRKLAKILRTWSPGPLTNSHARATFDLKKINLFEKEFFAFLKSNQSTKMQWRGAQQFPAAIRALIRLPEELTGRLPKLAAQSDSAQLNLYLNNPLVARLEIQPAKGSDFEKTITKYASFKLRNRIFNYLPLDSSLVLHLPNCGEMTNVTESVLLSSFGVKRIVEGEKMADTVTRVSIKDAISQIGGEAYAALVRKKGGRANTLLCIEPKDQRKAAIFAENLKKASGAPLTAEIYGDFLLLASGGDREEIIAAVKQSIGKSKPALGSRRELKRILAGMQTRELLFITAYPVDTAKALFGELISISGYYGVPGYGANVLSTMQDSVRNSDEPLTFSLGVSSDKLQALLSVPTEAYFDIANLLQKMFYMADDYNEKFAKHLLNLQIDRLKKEAPEIKDIIENNLDRRKDEQPAE